MVRISKLKHTQKLKRHGLIAAISVAFLLGIAINSYFVKPSDALHSNSELTASVNGKGASVSDNSSTTNSNLVSKSTNKTSSTSTAVSTNNTKSKTIASTSSTTTSKPKASSNSSISSTPSSPSATIAWPTTLYANPGSNVATNALSYGAANPQYASLMNRLAAVPMAQWYVGQEANIESTASAYVTAAANAHQVPVIVAYNIPDRDCGSYSAGGASSASAYTAWIDGLAAGIGNHPAMVILEPDALPGMDCLSSVDQRTRIDLIAAAVHTLKTTTAAKVYLDAGNYSWQSASTMAGRLESADIAEANGFSLNVSGFGITSASVSYGTQLSGLVGGKHFVVDTSRNGNGPDSNNDWCNPANSAVGQSPTLQTGNGLVDGYLWIKNVGESDGQCGSSEGGTNPPAAGVWWPQQAIAYTVNAGW